MKTLILVLAFLAGTTAAFAGNPEVTEKVMTQFKQTFKDAKDIVWKEYDEFYEVGFKLSGVQLVVRYDPEGNILRYLRYYSENQLPTLILLNAKKKYPDRTITGVTEFFNENELSYLITMKDSKHWYTVKSDPSGNLQQTEKLNKSE